MHYVFPIPLIKKIKETIGLHICLLQQHAVVRKYKTWKCVLEEILFCRQMPSYRLLCAFFKNRFLRREPKLKTRQVQVISKYLISNIYLQNRCTYIHTLRCATKQCYILSVEILHALPPHAKPNCLSFHKEFLPAGRIDLVALLTLKSAPNWYP